MKLKMDKALIIKDKKISALKLLKRVLPCQNKKGIIEDVWITNCMITNVNYAMKKCDSLLFDLEKNTFLGHKVRRFFVTDNVFCGRKNTSVRIVKELKKQIKQKPH